jgi:hypothetical protein
MIVFRKPVKEKATPSIVVFGLGQAPQNRPATTRLRPSNPNAQPLSRTADGPGIVIPLPRQVLFLMQQPGRASTPQAQSWSSAHWVQDRAHGGCQSSHAQAEACAPNRQEILRTFSYISPLFVAHFRVQCIRFRRAFAVEKSAMMLSMPTNLERLRSPGRHKAPDRKRPVAELIALLPRAEAERARRRLDQLEQACACGLGVAGAFAALALYATGVAFWLDLTANNAWMFGAIGFAVFVLGAGLGKTFGLIRVRSQRNRLIDELDSRLAILNGSAWDAPNREP